MKVKCHFCRGIMHFPQLGVSSEQPRVLDSLSHGHQCLWSCGQAWLGAATDICDIHLEMIFGPVKYSGQIFGFSTQLCWNQLVPARLLTPNPT